MALEIEHKYLVNSAEYREMAISKERICQGYLSDLPQATVRVRIKGDVAYLTIKGITTGATRAEYEYQIPLNDAEEMLKSLCSTSVIDKTRYMVMHDGRLWEVDEFHGSLEGLVLAEIELPSETTDYSLPSFVGENVTNDCRYYNSNLAKSAAIPKR